MRRITRIKQVFFTPFLFICFIHNIESSSIVHDAAFSPDGKVIGVGTDRFQILDPTSKNLIYSFQFPIGVKFLKWRQQRVLLVSGSGDSHLFFVRHKRIAYSFLFRKKSAGSTCCRYYGSDEYILA